MKKTRIAVFTALLFIFAALSALPAAADADEFEISGGVLTRYNGSSLTVTIPDGVKIIGDGAFAGSSTTVTVNFPDSVYSIGNRAFYDCTSLQSLNNTGNITEIGAYAFNNTAYVNFASADFVTVNGILIAYKGSGQQIEIPAEIVSIAPYAFALNDTLTSVKIGQTVRSIGEGAFYGCASLAQVTVSGKVMQIGALAFEGTEWLNSQTEDFVILGQGILIAYNGGGGDITLPRGVEQIGGGAFYGNSTVSGVTVQSGCLTVQIRAFANCENLRRVKLPSTVIGIDPLAFESSPLVTLAAADGSFAQQFADENSIPFELLEIAADLGDVNNDGKIDSVDATLILQKYAQLIDESCDGYYNSLADVDFSGEVDAADATLVLQMYAGLIDVF